MLLVSLLLLAFLLYDSGRPPAPVFIHDFPSVPAAAAAIPNVNGVPAVIGLHSRWPHYFASIPAIADLTSVLLLGIPLVHYVPSFVSLRAIADLPSVAWHPFSSLLS
jgi:hypothetical protein